MRFHQKHGDHADDGSVGFIAASEIAAFGDLEPEIDILAQPSLQDIGSFIGRAVVFNQRLSNFLRTAADQLDFALQEKAQTVDVIDVEWIADGDD